MWSQHGEPTQAALTACPNKLESDGFILIFPNSLKFLQKKSRHIESLVSPPSVRFKRQIDRCARFGDRRRVRIRYPSVAPA
jgi:hypothetical protein